ncbi:MBL fold metallo-hydrolase [Streptomyces sp. B8F3]|uniref:MBL fold metallo-hydrolase n=1 Tax=unclassified Streptomyces TaxID=2593676 RepID=UPI00325E57B9
MKLTVLGGCGAWPTAEAACSGYLVEHDGHRLLLDPGYAVMPQLLRQLRPGDVDAVVVTHGHPDHCADLHPLLRARALAEAPAPTLPVYAPAGALDAVLALDRPGMLRGSYELRAFDPATEPEFTSGPFRVGTRALPHHVPNAGLRLTAGGRVLAYTGDTGPSPALAELAAAADLFLAEATYPEEVPEEDAPYLSSARQAGEHATRAGAERLLLTHLWPGGDRDAAVAAARRGFDGDVRVARPGTAVEWGAG